VNVRLQGLRFSGHRRDQIARHEVVTPEELVVLSIVDPKRLRRNCMQLHGDSWI